MNGTAQRGFTLIELMVVVVIIAALASMVAVKLVERADEAKEKIARGDMSSLDLALKMYRLDVGTYPASDPGLDALLSAAAGKEPYLERPPLDPWGRKYIYGFPGNRNPGGYDLSSAGKDGREGTQDDIGNWP
jgi:general secretion pathway protein G